MPDLRLNNDSSYQLMEKFTSNEKKSSKKKIEGKIDLKGAFDIEIKNEKQN